MKDSPELNKQIRHSLCFSCWCPSDQMSSCNLPTTPSCSAPWVPCSIVAAWAACCRRFQRHRVRSCGKWCVMWPWRLGDWVIIFHLVISYLTSWGYHMISPWSRLIYQAINIFHPFWIDRCLPSHIPLSMVPCCHGLGRLHDIRQSGAAWSDMPYSYAGALEVKPQPLGDSLGS